MLVKNVEIIDFFKSFSILSHVHGKKTKNEDIVKFYNQLCNQLFFLFTHFLLLPIMHSIFCFSFSTIIISKLELAHKQLVVCFCTFSVCYCFTFIPCSKKVKLKNELVLSKCIKCKSWSMTISRMCMKAWKLHLCLQWMFILVNLLLKIGSFFFFSL